jgi:DNA-directed RNA polymerase specialized sigma subunit
VLNPARAGMVRSAKDWVWSSYRATAGQCQPHPLLTTDWILGNFGKKRSVAQEKYRQFVQAGKKQSVLWNQLKNQIYLGSDQFIEDMQCKIDPEQSLRDVPKPQKNSPVKALSFYKEKFKSRNRAMAEAYRSGHYTLAEVGNEFGVSYATVSRAVKELECQM